MFLLKRAEDKTRIQLEEKRDFSFFYGGVWLWTDVTTTCDVSIVNSPSDE